MIPEPHPSILKISPYVGGDITPKGMVRRIVLASNENALGTSPRVRQALDDMMDRLHMYPSGNASALKEAIASLHHLNSRQILTGTGSEELLHLLAKAYAGPGTEIMYPQYGFMVYSIATLCVGADPVVIPQPNFKTDVDEILNRITHKTKLIFLDNPGNPLGCKLTKDDLKRLVDQVPDHVLLVIDAAYAEYAEGSDYTSGLQWVADHPNLVITRTFSKIYGLAGLRVGWAYASEPVCDIINRIRAPFNVNSLGQRAAVEAIKDQQWMEHIKDYTLKWRTWLQDQLARLNLTYIPSYGNFILVDFSRAPRPAADVYQQLGRQGIIVRPTVPYKLPNHLRITIGKEEELQEFVDQLENILKP
jgi:histidinol-phosphate aminotransferase